MKGVDFIEFLKNDYFVVDDPDHDIEMRWLDASDGDTEWHTLFNESSMARYGLFPADAEYRRKVPK
jgi:hypothetical protein